MQTGTSFWRVNINQTLELLHSHRSDRSFTEQPIAEAELAAIVEAAYRGPTSINGQQVSLVVVRDPARRALLAEIAGGQPWIARAPLFITVLIDFAKTARAVAAAGEQQVIHESVEGFGVGAVDAGIALANLMLAARSLGLGVVPIGGIRKDAQAVIDLLELPQLTFPMCGVAIGHIDQPARQKPRLPLATFRHDETYRADALTPGVIADYDATISHYWQEIGRPEGLPWSRNLAGVYKLVYYRDTKPVAARQGFLNDK